MSRAPGASRTVRSVLGLAAMVVATPALAHGRGLGLLFFGLPLLLLCWAGLLVRALCYLPRRQRWRVAGWTLLGAPLAVVALGIGWALLSELLAPLLDEELFETLWVLAAPFLLALLGWKAQGWLSRRTTRATARVPKPASDLDPSPVPDALIPLSAEPSPDSSPDSTSISPS